MKAECLRVGLWESVQMCTQYNLVLIYSLAALHTYCQFMTAPAPLSNPHMRC